MLVLGTFHTHLTGDVASEISVSVVSAINVPGAAHAGIGFFIASHVPIRIAGAMDVLGTLNADLFFQVTPDVSVGVVSALTVPGAAHTSVGGLVASNVPILVASALDVLGACNSITIIIAAVAVIGTVVNSVKSTKFRNTSVVGTIPLTMVEPIAFGVELNSTTSIEL